MTRLGLPKYMEDMHLVVNSITGEISIAKIKLENGKGSSPVQKYVTDEFFSCLMVKADKLPMGNFLFNECTTTDEARLLYVIAKSPSEKTTPEILRAMADLIESNNIAKAVEPQKGAEENDNVSKQLPKKGKKKA